MTVEAQLAALTQASNSLVGYYNNKKADIDNAVAAAVAAAPLLKRQIYVDSIAGDNANDGSADNPYQTLAYAVNSLPSGSFGTVNLTPGIDYVIDNSIDVTNKVIYLRCTDFNNHARIRNICTIDNATVGFFGVDGLIKSINVDYKTAEFLEPENPSNAISNGIFNLPSATGLKVLIFQSDIELNDTSLFSQYAGSSLDATVHAITFTETGENAQGQLLTNRTDTVTRLSSGVTVLPAGKAWSDMISEVVRAADNEPKNILTHLAL